MDSMHPSENPWKFKNFHLIDRAIVETFMNIETGDFNVPLLWEKFTLHLSQKLHCRLAITNKTANKSSYSITIYFKHGQSCNTRLRLSFKRNEITNNAYFAALYTNNINCTCSKDSV